MSWEEPRREKTERVGFPPSPPGFEVSSVMGIILHGSFCPYTGSWRTLGLGLRLKVGHYIKKEIDLLRVKVGEFNVDGSLSAVGGVSTM